MTKTLTVLICFLAACSARYLGTQDIQYTSQGNPNIQNLQWQWPLGMMSSQLTLTFPRKTYIHSIDVITCCFESSHVDITAIDDGIDVYLGSLGDPTKKATAVFTYYVTGDDKEDYAVEEILLRKGSQVLLTIPEINGGQWGKGSVKTFRSDEFIVVPSDFTDLNLLLRQRTDGDDDDMEFDFAAQIYDHTGSLIYSNRWNGLKLHSDDGWGDLRLNLGAFQYAPEHHVFNVEKYANTIEMTINVNMIQNLKIQSIMITSPDCSSNQYYMNGCKDCNPLCKSCFGPNPDEECFDCTYGKGPNVPYGNCCPQWCQGCNVDNYCSSCIAHTPIYNYWDGVCYRPVELSEYFLGSEDETNFFFPCHERCLSCTKGGPQDCIICRYGRGVYDNKCCPPFCKKCDSADKCTLCMDGYLQYQFQCYKTCPGQLVSYDVLKCELRDVDTRPPVTPRGKDIPRIDFLINFTIDNKGYKLNKFVPARHFFSQIDPSYANINWKCYNDVSSATIGAQGSFLAATATMLRVGGVTIAKNAEINPKTLASTLSKFFIDEKCRFLFNFDKLLVESSVRFKKNFLLMKGGEPSLIDLMSTGTLEELYKLFDYQQIYNSYLYIASDSSSAEKDKYVILTIWKIISKENEDDFDYSSHAAVLFEWKNFDSTQTPQNIYNAMTLTIIDPLKPKGSLSPTQQLGLCFEDNQKRGCLKELKVYEIIKS